jgi:hypothetical protein
MSVEETTRAFDVAKSGGTPLTSSGLVSWGQGDLSGSTWRGDDDGLYFIRHFGDGLIV